MNNPYRSLPPLTALVGFEAAARHGSFSRAAEELNITQSAISHQVRTLEDHLGQPLFHRIGRRIDLTDAGRDLRQTAQEALETVRHGVRRLHAYTKPGSVIVMMSPALAQGWFLPRLARLRAALPDVEPWLHTTDETWVPEEAEIDISISTRPWQDDGTITAPLTTDRLWPMAAPTLAVSLPDDPDQTRLDTAPLLHDEGVDDWQKWFAKAQSGRKDFSSGLNFSDPGMMLQAAALGHGVCLGSEILARPLLDQGGLVRVGSSHLECSQGFHISAWKRTLSRQAVTDTWQWLCDQALED
ncbi:MULTISPECIES: LysR family transcriptional regulator [unclassified Roseovarius]|uniref:LysR family transcriptional regulator n=1 Tax=unclassified Roseovarius TaxID=2614913 RepID=UPI00273EBDCF|nr:MULTISPECIES: LysR family transcriptional regulator [unclassified Roseovarius]